MERRSRDRGRSAAPLQIMQSRGGVASSRVARRSPVRLFLSGPAAGVIGGSMAGAAAGYEDVITIDIGGTSADIALVNGGQPLIAAGRHARRLCRARADGRRERDRRGRRQHRVARRGRLAARRTRIGRVRARARPATGAAASRPTVTDASIVLGYIDPGYFAGGTMALDAGPRLDPGDRAADRRSRSA